MAATMSANPTQRAAIIGQAATTGIVLRANLGGVLRTDNLHGATSDVDAVTNDSDKTFVVPTNKVWHVHAVHVSIITTATAGNRRITVEARDASDNVLARIPSTDIQAASSTETWAFSGGAGGDNGQVGVEHNAAMPARLILPEGYDLRVYDLAAVDAAADDMTVSILYQEVDE